MTTRPPAEIGMPLDEVDTPALVIDLDAFERNLARLAAVIGLDAAKALLLTARLADALEAHRIGFLHELAPDDDGVLPQALRIAGEIAQLAPLTLRVSKEMARRIRAATPLPDGGDLLRLCYGSDDFHAGVAAFLAKRSARWSGH